MHSFSSTSVIEQTGNNLHKAVSDGRKQDEHDVSNSSKLTWHWWGPVHKYLPTISVELQATVQRNESISNLRCRCDAKDDVTENLFFVTSTLIEKHKFV